MKVTVCNLCVGLYMHALIVAEVVAYSRGQMIQYYGSFHLCKGRFGLILMASRSILELVDV